LRRLLADLLCIAKWLAVNDTFVVLTSRWLETRTFTRQRISIAVKLILAKWPAHLGVGLVAGAAIVYVDNCAFEGEVSPIIIVALLLGATAMAGAMWGRSGWLAAAVIWACLPLAHVVKHVLDLPDTLHPNTYTSILYLAAFTLVVAAGGTGCGVLVRRLATGRVRRDQGPA
jgi:hypothetical protein